MKVTAQTLEAFQDEARLFAQRLKPLTKGAVFITLSGELGAGKTTFVQTVAKSLGVTEHITSPTFVLEKMYRLPETSAFKNLVHIDAYRLDSGKDLLPLDFEKLTQDSDTIIMLEWPERVEDTVPVPNKKILLTAEDDGSHTITYV